MEPIKELNEFGMRTKTVQDGYDLKEIPSAHPENIELIVDKLNEVIRAINEQNL